jgi:hypothetical protein
VAGIAGLRLEHGGCVVYVDPYLSDSVEKFHGPEYRRQVPIPVAPGVPEEIQLVYDKLAPAFDLSFEPSEY